MAKRKVAAIVKIQIQAGAATPAPPVGTALGPHGINIMDFCKAYNAQTESQRGTVIPAEITIYEDRSFTVITKTPPTPVLLRQAEVKMPASVCSLSLGSACRITEIAWPSGAQAGRTTLSAGSRMQIGILPVDE